MNLERGRAFWQFELSGVALLPRLVAWGKVGDIEGEFWLKVWGERLLFCASKEPKKVFALTTPCLKRQNLVEFWRRRVDEGQFGRLVLSKESLVGTDETFTGFVFLCMEDGRRWMREWCGNEWLPQRRMARPSSLPIWHPAWGEPTSRSLEISEEMRLALLARPFSEAERRDCSLMWLAICFRLCPLFKHLWPREIDLGHFGEQVFRLRWMALDTMPKAERNVARRMEN